MIDQFERNIDYLRISVTDRCNLRCRYCMPKEGITCVNHPDILTYEEITAVADAAARAGIRKIKITGGEPLVRKGIPSLIRRLKNIPGIKEVTMTSNGILLKEMAQELKAAGLDGINVSLDTLDREKYKLLTRFDGLEQVLAGIREAADIGLKTKLNCLPLQGFNENDLIEIASFANYNIAVRFIELMPIGLGREFTGISFKEVKKILEKVYGASRINYEKHGNGPAVYYNFNKLKGCIGFIAPISNEFCNDCNRIRLTAEGELKLCLHYDQGISLKPYLRESLINQFSISKLQLILEEAIYNKPGHHCFLEKDKDGMELRKMVQIGG